MRIALIGAGFSGLAIAWHLLSQSAIALSSLTLFDVKPIGTGTSGIAAGLLHPFTGAHAKLNQMGKEGVQATLELLQVSSKALGQPVFSQSGILRLALTEMQESDFKACHIKNPSDAEWLDPSLCQQAYPLLPQAPGLWIKPGYTVYSSLYLQGLWTACFQLGAKLEERAVNTWEELSHFDLIIMAGGAHCQTFPGLSSLKLSTVKGQVLELEWPLSLPSLPFPLNSQGYLLMNHDKTRCLTGATFEKQFHTTLPDRQVAEQDILPKLYKLLPAIEPAQVLNCQAGLRAVTPNHLPVIKQIDKNKWVMTGLGSKGLLYHALMAQKLIQEIRLSLNS